MEQQLEISARDGVKLGYKLSRVPGAKHSLVLLNGLATNHTRWSEFVAHSKLSRLWNVMRGDRRGHGLSMYRGHISRPIWIEDLDQIIENEKLAPVVLLGHSLGTEVAMDYVARFPDKVEALILIDPVFPENLRGRLGLMRRLRWLIWIPIVIVWFFNLLGIRRRRFPAHDLYLIDQEARARLAANPEMKLAEIYTNPLGDLPYLPLANYMQDLYEAARPLPPLKSIRQPVLALISLGTSVAYRKLNQARIAELPNVECQFIDCDHWPLTEKPEQVRQMIDDWCLKQFDEPGQEANLD